MLHRLQLERFQGYKNPQEIRLAPLTLIFGPNSSGKSSIIRSLLLLAQSAAQGEFQLGMSNKLNYVGELTNLVSFSNVSYGHTDGPIKLGLVFDLRAFPGRHVDTSSNSWTCCMTWLSDEAGIAEIEISAAASRTNEAKRKENTPDNANVHLRFHRSGNGMKIDFKSSIFAGLDLDWRTGAPSKSLLSSTLNRNVYRPLKEIEFRTEGLVPMPYNFTSTSRRPQELGSPQRAIIEFLSTVRSSLFGHVRGVTHVGPLRQVPKRVEVLGTRQNRLASDGENLNEFIENSVEKQRFMKKWVRQLTHGDYEIQQISLNASRFPFLGNHVSLVLTDVGKNTPVSLQDAGVGLSQVLPIIAQIAPAESIRGRRKMVLIEQPELHLHPRMQGDLTDALIDAVNHDQGPQIIAETHSENMVLRIQRRIRDGSLKAEDVNIIYVDRAGANGNFVTSLELDAAGAFLDSWPTSFAESRLDDLLDSL